MKIGFDLDGIVLHIDIPMLRHIDMMEDRKLADNLAMCYYSSLRMQLNPIEFLADGDELYFITGRHDKYREYTENWARKYFPQATLVHTFKYEEPTNIDQVKSWLFNQSEYKAKVINSYHIDVYFEDCAEVVQELRKKCPNTKIIQYGGRMKL